MGVSRRGGRWLGHQQHRIWWPPRLHRRGHVTEIATGRVDATPVVEDAGAQRDDPVQRQALRRSVELQLQRGEGVQLGRRFRALKLWMVLRSFGVAGLQERIRYHCELARQFAAWVEAEPGLELVAPVPFSTVCFRATPDLPPEHQDRINEQLLERVNAAGPVFLSHTRLRGRYVLRLTVGNLRTTPAHLERAQQIIRTAHSQALATYAP